MLKRVQVNIKYLNYIATMGLPIQSSHLSIDKTMISTTLKKSTWNSCHGLVNMYTFSLPENQNTHKY